jgi:hypothetical protein
MPAFTLVQAQAQLDAWLAASLAVATSQSYEITVEGNTRKLSRADAGEIRRQIDFWRVEVTRLTPAASRRPRSRTIVN